MTSPIAIFPQTPPQVLQRGDRQPDQLASHAPTFAVYTLGCKVNQSDTHAIARMLMQRGFRRVEFREGADLYVIDTCTVTNEADRKSRKIAGRARRNNPEAVVAVTGCAATYSREQFLRVVPDALVLSNAQKFDLPELAIAQLQQRDQAHRTYWQQHAQLRATDAVEPLPEATRERAVLKIQDGCNHKCSYCIIPQVRGASVLKNRAQILREAQHLIAEGAREITVTGVSLGDWKEATSRTADQGRNAALCDLLREIAALDGLERLRVSSLDPADVDEQWLQTIAHTPKICPQIHLALQSGSASTLRRMRRRYTPELFLKWAKRWREIRPDGGLTTDIIVGFPGETREEFEQSLHVAREAQFSHIHVFPYSPRDNTVAAALPDAVAPREQKQRMAQLLQLADELAAQYAAQFIGKTVPVLVETIAPDGTMEGMIPHYLKARLKPVASTCKAGDVLPMRVEHFRDGALQGVLQNVEPS